jgi:hypothetical protein
LNLVIMFLFLSEVAGSFFSSSVLTLKSSLMRELQLSESSSVTLSLTLSLFLSMKLSVSY